VSYPNLRLSPALAAAALLRFKTGFPDIFHFWPDEASLTDSSLFQLGVLTGSRQIPNAYLAGLAFRKGGRLATLDANIPWRAVRGAGADLVERIVP
jgi:hypothetical protein